MTECKVCKLASLETRLQLCLDQHIGLSGPWETALVLLSSRICVPMQRKTFSHALSRRPGILCSVSLLQVDMKPKTSYVSSFERRHELSAALNEFQDKAFETLHGMSLQDFRWLLSSTPLLYHWKRFMRRDEYRSPADESIAAWARSGSMPAETDETKIVRLLMSLLTAHRELTRDDCCTSTGDVL